MQIENLRLKRDVMFVKHVFYEDSPYLFFFLWSQESVQLYPDNKNVKVVFHDKH